MIKRYLSVLITALILISCFSVSSFATEQADDSINTAENSQERATGLITSYSISLTLTGSTLKISGKTVGIAEVVKCGFDSVIVERRANSSSDWEEYKEYSDLYVDGTSYTLTKQLNVNANYQYRVTCVHYAKKNIISVQRIDNVSNVV